MCWNPEVSIGTFLFGVVTLIMMWIRVCCGVGIPVPNKKCDGSFLFFLLFCFSFMSMQGVEYKLWTVGGDPRMNRLWSIIAFVLVLVQPLLSVLRMQDTHIKDTRDRLLALYAFYLGVLIVWYVPRKTFLTDVAPSGHLRWRWAQSTGIENFVLLIHFVILFLPYLYVSSTLSTAFFIGTLIFSLLFYSRDGTWGSMWCWTVNIACLYCWWEYMIQPYLSQEKMEDNQNNKM